MLRETLASNFYDGDHVHQRPAGVSAFQRRVTTGVFAASMWSGSGGDGASPLGAAGTARHACVTVVAVERRRGRGPRSAR